MVDKKTAVLLILIIALGIIGLVDRRHQLHRVCLSTENLKAGQRESAQATIIGDNALLYAHDHPKPGQPPIDLPVPRQAILADIAAKQRTVDRYPPRKC